MLSITTPTANAGDAIERLLDNRDVNGLAIIYVDYVARSPEAVPDYPQQYVADWRAAAGLAYDAKAVRAGTRDIFSDTLRHEGIGAMLAFMGKAMSPAELTNDGYATELFNSYVKELATLAQQKPDRYALYQELLGITYTIHSMVGVPAGHLAPLLKPADAEEYIDMVTPVIEGAAEPGMTILIMLECRALRREDQRNPRFLQNAYGKRVPCSRPGGRSRPLPQWHRHPAHRIRRAGFITMNTLRWARRDLIPSSAMNAEASSQFAIRTATLDVS